MPKTVISSIDLYSNHSLSYYCWAEVIDGKITELGDETGRDGGVIWSKIADEELNGNLQHCLTDLGNHYGMEFYKKVYSEANRDTPRLLTPQAAQMEIEKADLKYVSEEIKNAEARLVRSKKKLDRILERRRLKGER